MLLWTWQSRDFSLANGEKVKSLEYSFYCNKGSDCSKEKHWEAYEKVFEKLGTDQLIWCFTNYDEATKKASIMEFEEIQDRILWKIDVPEKEIKWYCPVVWGKLRTDRLKKLGFVGTIYNSLHADCKERAENFEKEFNDYWSDETEDELLDLMFLKKRAIFDVGPPDACTLGCSEAIIIHPVDKESIKKNPLEVEKWWGVSRYTHDILPGLNENKKLIETIPCLNCPGR